MDKACHILGLLGYYRSFIPAFANISLPITSLLKKNTPFVWSDKCQLALEYLKDIFCNKPLLQFPDPNKPYELYTNASNNVYSSANLLIMTKILAQLHIFQAPSQHKMGVGVQLKRSLCCIKSMQCFDYYLQGAKCTLHHDHKPLEPFLTRGMKIAKLDILVMLLQDYDIIFAYIKGKDNILANAISRLHTIAIYEKTIETQYSHAVKTTTLQLGEVVEQIQHVNSSPLPQSLNMNSITLGTLQKQDKFCKNKVYKLHSGIDNTFYLNSDSILKQSLMINNLEVCMTVVPLALTHTLIHEFHNCRGHQGCARTLNALKRRFWWKG